MGLPARGPANPNREKNTKKEKGRKKKQDGDHADPPAGFQLHIFWVGDMDLLVVAHR